MDIVEEADLLILPLYFLFAVNKIITSVGR